MTRERRYDHGTLRKPEQTAQGFLKGEGYVGKPGLYRYINTTEHEKAGWGKAGTERIELRPDDEVFSMKALAGFELAPLTNGHPRKPDGQLDEVTPANVRQLEVGTVGSARRDGDRVAATLVIKDAKAIKAVKAGRQQLSPGYDIDYDPTPGVDPKYGRYDGVQRNIVINHLALVDVARGGTDLRMRMDGESRADGQQRLTSAVDGHQHLIDLYPSPESYCANETSWAVAEGADIGHSHPLVRNPDGSITIGESAGHTHTILDEQRYAAPRADAELDAAERKQLSDDDFAVPAGRKLPIADAAHVRAAMSRFSQTEFVDDKEKRSAYHRIVARAKSLDVDASGFVEKWGGDMRADSQIDRSAGAREGHRMADTDANADVSEKLRLQTVRADEQEKLATGLKTDLESSKAEAQKQKARADSAEEKVGELKAQIAAGATAVETEAVRDARKRADDAERELAQLKASRADEIRERCNIVLRAQAVMGPKFRADSLSNREICAQVVKHLRPKEDTSEKVSDAYLQSRFDSLIEGRMETDASNARASAILANPNPAKREDAAGKPLAWADQWKSGAGQFSTATGRKEA